MNQKFLPLLIALLAIQGQSVQFGAPLPGAEQSITIVREETNGNPNQRKKVAWHAGITLGEVLVNSDSHFSFHVVYAVVSAKTITLYSGSAAVDPSALEGQINPGDVVVLGPVDAKRANELDAVPEIEQRLGGKWSECKHRIRHRIEHIGATSSSSPTP